MPAWAPVRGPCHCHRRACQRATGSLRLGPMPLSHGHATATGSLSLGRGLTERPVRELGGGPWCSPRTRGPFIEQPTALPWEYEIALGLGHAAGDSEAKKSAPPQS